MLHMQTEPPLDVNLGCSAILVTNQCANDFTGVQCDGFTPIPSLKKAAHKRILQALNVR